MDIPEPQIDPKLIADMLEGYQVTRALCTAMDYDIFTLLEKSKTAKEVAEEIGTDFEITKKFLNALVALKLLSKINDKYINTALAGTYFVKGKPFYQGNLVNLVAKDYDTWSKLGQALKEGGIQQKTDEKQWSTFNQKSFILAMAEASMKGTLHKVTKQIVDIPEFKNAKKLIDLGGGHGLYAIAFAQMNPDLKAIVFDLSPVVEVTKDFILQYGMEDRVKVMAGDFNKDDFGNGYDIIFVSHSLFYQPKEAMHRPLEKIHKALKDGGILISHHWVLNNDGTSSSSALALWDLQSSSFFGHHHHIYTEGEFVDFLKENKFSVMHILNMSDPQDPPLIIAKKEDNHDRK